MKELHMPQEHAARHEQTEKRERSIVSIVYDGLHEAFGSKTWDDLTYAETDHALVSMFDHAIEELDVKRMPFKIAREYEKEIVLTMMDRIPEVFSDVGDEEWSEVYERMAFVFTESRNDIYKKALDVLPANELGSQSTRFKFGRLLVESDTSSFLELESLGFDVKDRLTIARRISERRGTNFFELLENAGVRAEDILPDALRFFPLLSDAYARFKRLSPDDAEAFMKNADMSVRGHVSRAFGFPERKRSFEKKDSMHATNVHEYEHPIDVETFRMQEDHLLRTLIASYPERKDAYENKAKRTERLRGEIEFASDLEYETCGKPMFVYFKDKEVLPAVYKPQAHDVADMRNGIEAGTYSQREWLAYQIDLALQIDSIPATILRNGPKGPGTVQEWKAARAVISPRELLRAKAEDLESVAFDDIVKQNTDGHLGNVLIGYDGSLIGIDHSWILSDDPQDFYIKSECFDFLRQRGIMVSNEVMRKINAFQNSAEVRNALKKCFEVALKDKAEVCWKKFEHLLTLLASANDSQVKY